MVILHQLNFQGCKCRRHGSISVQCFEMQSWERMKDERGSGCERVHGTKCLEHFPVLQIFSFSACCLPTLVVLQGWTVPCCVHKIPPCKGWQMHSQEVCEQTSRHAEIIHHHCLHVWASPGNTCSFGQLTGSVPFVAMVNLLGGNVAWIMMALRISSRDRRNSVW